MEKKKVSIVFGTRPEAIKLIPVILELQKEKDFEVNVCVTAQHREMLDQVLEIFDVVPNVDLNLMKPNQTLSGLTANIISSVDKYFTEYKPDIVLVQGDTTTVMAVSLVAFYHKIKVGHVEAGLRTHKKFSPFPEEINRVLTSRIADLHFAPTAISKQNLLDEKIAESDISITGNTVIDALFLATKKVEEINPKVPGLENYDLKNLEPYVLITGHRRENFGDGFINICGAIAELAEKYKDHNFIYPVHLNPNVQDPVKKILSGKKNVYLLEPQTYLPFISLMMNSKIILTDSGGVQEEAPSLGKPVLVMRENTERPEAVTAGTVKLVGTEKHTIINEVSKLIDSKEEYNKMANAVNPYGDGLASKRIVDILKNYFNK
ncbi:MAG: UDP-N-acetylglucosamine 2-epimerase (non-hydrolyzing) [Ignavibacteriales bacterium]|nr:UDP-N-acetylglucosamine 2-epimerase (non-hydrolyzing) [Ignavibacteriales bacterium]